MKVRFRHARCCCTTPSSCIHCIDEPPSAIMVEIEGFTESACDGTYILPYRGEADVDNDTTFGSGTCNWWLSNPFNPECPCGGSIHRNWMWIRMFPNFTFPHDWTFTIFMSGGNAGCWWDWQHSIDSGEGPRHDPPSGPGPFDCNLAEEFSITQHNTGCFIFGEEGCEWAATPHEIDVTITAIP